MNKSVSIVIPVFNAAPTLRAAIESALSQDEVCEIIVSDDGSTDESFRIASSYGGKVRSFSGPNMGVSHARNVGISRASSDWFIFLDSDDVLAPATVSKRLIVARRANDVVISDWDDVVDDGQGNLKVLSRRSVDWEALQSDAEAAIASHVWATTAAILYPRAIVHSVGGFREELPVIQDARFLFDAARCGASFVHADHVGASYRIVEGSLSRRRPERFWLDVLHNGQQIESLWRAGGDVTDEREAVLARIFDVAARGLVRTGDRGFFEALKAGAGLRKRTSFIRWAGVVAPVLGLAGTRALMQALRRI